MWYFWCPISQSLLRQKIILPVEKYWRRDAHGDLYRFKNKQLSLTSSFSYGYFTSSLGFFIAQQSLYIQCRLYLGPFETIPWEIRSGLNTIKEEFIYPSWCGTSGSSSVCLLLSAAGYDNINLLYETDPASSDCCRAVGTRWVSWINIYGSMTWPILVTGHQWTGVWESNVGGNGSWKKRKKEKSSQSKNKTL